MLWRDIRHAVRRLAKDRSLTLMAVAALSLGIGANNTVFTFVNARFVARFLEGEEPLGRRIRLNPDGDTPGPWLSIVGVSPTIRQSAIQEAEPDAVVYRLHRLQPAQSLAIQGQVIWLVMRRGMIQLVVGLSIGLIGASGVGRVLEGLLVQVSPTDPVTVAMILACLGPARRAAALDPSDALRVD